jgi:hypothetical protein
MDNHSDDDGLACELAICEFCGKRCNECVCVDDILESEL